MNKKTILNIVGVVSLLVLAVGPARADLFLNIDLNEANADIDALGLGSANFKVTESAQSDLLLKTQDTSTLAVLDRANIIDDGFKFLFDINLTQVAAEIWTATGTLKFSDTDEDGLDNIAGNADDWAVLASFNSTGVGFVNQDLQIVGLLSGSPILVNRGTPWVYVGEGFPQTPNTPNADGVVGTITIDGPGGFDSGTILDITVGLGQVTSSLDVLFGSDRCFPESGEVKGKVTPAPGAVLLGALGLGMVGWLRRRIAG